MAKNQDKNARFKRVVIGYTDAGSPIYGTAGQEEAPFRPEPVADPITQNPQRYRPEPATAPPAAPEEVQPTSPPVQQAPPLYPNFQPPADTFSFPQGQQPGQHPHSPQGNYSHTTPGQYRGPIDGGNYDFTGWTPTGNKNTGKFAKFMSGMKTNGRPTYRQDAEGNGYFAPGWNHKRLTKSFRIFQFALAGFVIIALGLSTVSMFADSRTQTSYNTFKEAAVETTATVTEVQQSRSRSTSRSSSSSTSKTRYTTDTFADVSYSFDGDKLSGSLRHSETDTFDYPEPAWHPGGAVSIYVDPNAPESIMKKDNDREGRADGSFNIGSLFSTLFFVSIPLTGIILLSKVTRRIKEL